MTGVRSEESDYETAETAETAEKEVASVEDDFYNQYAVSGKTNFTPIAETINKLPPGYYKIIDIQDTLYFAKQVFNISELIRFKETAVDAVINEFDKFWGLKEHYLDRGEPHRRGFMLWGPPGGGKTSTISIIADEFIRQGNLVIDFNQHFSTMIGFFRQIEPDRKIILLIEDIDTLVEDRYMEGELLHLLDGDIELVNTAIIATTNFPENLPDRIINRPSRFDRIAYIGMPGEIERRIYLKQKSREKMSKKELEKWVNETEGFSFAHLKELILSVEVFKNGYDKTIKRLNSMRTKKSSSDDYEKELHGQTDESFGFTGRKKEKD